MRFTRSLVYNTRACVNYCSAEARCTGYGWLHFNGNAGPGHCFLFGYGHTYDCDDGGYDCFKKTGASPQLRGYNATRVIGACG